jgi:hypothetical protein
LAVCNLNRPARFGGVWCGCGLGLYYIHTYTYLDTGEFLLYGWKGYEHPFASDAAFRGLLVLDGVPLGD